MKILFAYVNATAAVRDHLARDDLEDEDVEKIISEQFTCHCESCIEYRSMITSDETACIPGGVFLFTRDKNFVQLRPAM